jgi:hypothetical protein
MISTYRGYKECEKKIRRREGNSISVSDYNQNICVNVEEQLLRPYILLRKYKI